MFAPKVQQGFRVPRSIVPVVLALVAVAGTVVAWAALSARPIATESHFVPLAAVNPGLLRSVAYSEPGADVDRIFVRRIDGDPPREPLATFTHVLRFHARGLASPRGDVIAVLSVSNYPGTFARMTLVDTATGAKREVDAEFEYLSHLAWSPDGGRVAGVRYTALDEAGRAAANVLETDAGGHATTVAARFENVLEVAPVGYSADGARLYVVVIDQGGSTLWMRSGGRLERVGTLSAGRTRDWSLSPDGARLAYVDIRAGSGPTYAGRAMLIATGAVTETAAEANQVGAAWMPGGGAADFGGPGGTVRLSVPSAGEEYVVPIRWSPDGTTLAARIVANGGESDGTGGPADSIELATSSARIRLSDAEGAWVFGWVRNVE